MTNKILDISVYKRILFFDIRYMDEPYSRTRISCLQECGGDEQGWDGYYGHRSRPL
jgi:hypothetical protein